MEIVRNKTEESWNNFGKNRNVSENEKSESFLTFLHSKAEPSFDYKTYMMEGGSRSNVNTLDYNEKLAETNQEQQKQSSNTYDIDKLSELSFNNIHCTFLGVHIMPEQGCYASSLEYVFFGVILFITIVIVSLWQKAFEKHDHSFRTEVRSVLGRRSEREMSGEELEQYRIFGMGGPMAYRDPYADYQHNQVSASMSEWI